MTKSSRSSLYFAGIAWFILSLVISVTNDVFAKYLGQNLHSVQITFMRFFFGTMILIPFMLYYGKKSFYTSRIGLHVIRGVLLFAGIALWCYGLTITKITVATTLNFTIPFFILVLALIFLKEKVGWARWAATAVGFFGVLIVLEPTHMNFTPQTMLILVSAVMFAMLDVINKKYVVKESMLAMLFYTALFTMLLAAIPAYFLWQTPSVSQVLLSFFLGCGANLILYCLLKAFAAADASAIAPFRYVELILSAGVGYFLFKEIPSWSTWVGAAVIVPTTFFVVYYEIRKSKKSSNKEEEVLEPETSAV